MSYAKVEHIEADAIEAERDIHPALKRPWPKPAPRVCRACGFEPYGALTEDGLCAVCDKIVSDLERGIIS